MGVRKRGRNPYARPGPGLSQQSLEEVDERRAAARRRCRTEPRRRGNRRFAADARRPFMGECARRGSPCRICLRCVGLDAMQSAGVFDRVLLRLDAPLARKSVGAGFRRGRAGRLWRVHRTFSQTDTHLQHGRGRHQQGSPQSQRSHQVLKHGQVTAPLVGHGHTTIVHFTWRLLRVPSRVGPLRGQPPRRSCGGAFPGVFSRIICA